MSVFLSGVRSFIMAIQAFRCLGHANAVSVTTIQTAVIPQLVYVRIVNITRLAISVSAVRKDSMVMHQCRTALVCQRAVEHTQAE